MSQASLFDLPADSRTFPEIMGWTARHPNFGHPSEYPDASEIQPTENITDDGINSFLFDKYRKVRPEKRLAWCQSELAKITAELADDIKRYDEVRDPNAKPTGYQSLMNRDWPEWMMMAESCNFKRNHIIYHKSKIAILEAEIEKLRVA